MNYTWKKEDIICGRIVCKPRKHKFQTDLGWQAKWTYKIGWLCGYGRYGLNSLNGNDRNNYILIALTDGMVTKHLTKSELINWLDKNEMVPASHSHVMEIMEYLRDCYEN